MKQLVRIFGSVRALACLIAVAPPVSAQQKPEALRLHFRLARRLSLFDAAESRIAGLILNAPYQFISNGGYSRNTLAAVTKMCCVTVRGGSVSPASRRKASGSTS
jgi:hypothetical protein